MPLPVQIMLLDELRQRHGYREGPALDRWIVSTSNRGRDVLLLAKRLLPRICAEHHRARTTLAVLLARGSVISTEALGLPL